ncbi:unnamed protein product, partial [Rotaria sordida]
LQQTDDPLLIKASLHDFGFHSVSAYETSTSK